jgi:hypothetical protein
MYFDGENILFNASLVIYINITNIPPIMIINRIYEHLHFLVISVNNPRIDSESDHRVCRNLLCGFIVQLCQMISAFAKDLEN